MRTSLFLSTLFAVSLFGGAALADKHGAHSATPREPRVVERLRAHGDVQDKAYRSADAGAGAAAAASTQAPAPAHGRAPMAPGANRVNCSDSGVDCLAAKGKAPSQAVGGGDSFHGGHRDVRPPGFLDKVLGSDRTNLNEAGEDQGMSRHAAQRAWSRAAGVQHGDRIVVTLGVQHQVDRKSGQASDARMASNEDDVGFMSPKAARKEWAKASIAAGTWKGPAVEPVSNATRRIAEQRASEGAADKQPAAKDGPAKEEHASSDHPH